MTFLILYYGFTFLFGICIGSFLNVCIYRIPKRISVASGRSFCPNCKTQLNACDLFPIVSYIVLKGKCRYCGCRISPQYPIIELLTGLLFLSLALKYNFSPTVPIYAIFFCCLICIALIDLKHGIIPDRFHIVIAVLAVISYFTLNGIWYDRLLGLTVSAFMFLIAFVFGGFGGGDIKLMAVCGLLLGFQLTLLAFMIAAISAALFALPILIKKKEKREKHTMPFGPSLAFGLIISTLFGTQIISWYLSLLYLG